MERRLPAAVVRPLNALWILHLRPPLLCRGAREKTDGESLKCCQEFPD